MIRSIQISCEYMRIKGGNPTVFQPPAASHVGYSFHQSRTHRRNTYSGTGSLAVRIFENLSRRIPLYPLQVLGWGIQYVTVLLESINQIPSPGPSGNFSARCAPVQLFGSLSHLVDVTGMFHLVQVGLEQRLASRLLGRLTGWQAGLQRACNPIMENS